MNKFKEKIKAMQKEADKIEENLTDDELDAKFKKTLKLRKREERTDGMIGFYFLWAIGLGSVGTVYLLWKLVSWIFNSIL